MAVACRSVSVIASTPLQGGSWIGFLSLFMVASLFPWLGQSGRDDPHSRARKGVSATDGKQAVLDQAEWLPQRFSPYS